MDIEPRPTEAELQAFVGPRAEKYWRKWRWYIENDKRSAGTLWPPFLFNFVWFLYRRMYRELWVPIALVFVVGFQPGSTRHSRRRARELRTRSHE